MTEKFAVPWALRAMSGPPHLAKPQLRYSKVAKGFAVIALGGAAIATFVGGVLHPGGMAMLALTGVVSALAAEFFGVRHHYDNTGITYRSAWSRRRRVSWSEIDKVEWRPTVKWLDLKTRDGRRLHLPPMLGGLAGFAQLALRQISPLAWVQGSEAQTVLRLMAAGHGAILTTDARPPGEIARRLGMVAEESVKPMKGLKRHVRQEP
jgi:hypothetical protein